jgi:hypothetical protein
LETRASNLPDDKSLVRARLKTPKAAAVAGIVFAVLMIVILWLLRRSIPADPLESGVWLTGSTRTVMLALNLVPFAGVAFLWFIGVLRDRLGAQEDRFFSTVFLGSSLLFLASIFTAASLAGAITLVGESHGSDMLINSETYYLMRAATYIMFNVYCIKMAAIFMISTSTIIIYTSITPKWIAAIGYFLGFSILFAGAYISWSFAVLPIWVLLMALYILIQNPRLSH